MLVYKGNISLVIQLYNRINSGSSLEEHELVKTLTLLANVWETSPSQNFHPHLHKFTETAKMFSISWA